MLFIRIKNLPVFGLGNSNDLDGAWIRIYDDGTACLDGDFTAEELIKIAAAIEKAKA